MTNTLLDISGNIEPHKAEVLAAVDRAARKLGISYFVVGGAARDFILLNGYGIQTPRVTLDVDIGVSVSSWEEFKRLIEILLSAENFKTTDIEYRFVSPTLQKTKVDILPFGVIEGKERTIHWQHDNREMTMEGFREAYHAAIEVKIISTPSVIVKMVSLAGLALLKLISWNEKPNERDRDAKDFKAIMYHYHEVHHLEYLYNLHGDITSGDDFELTWARVLGRDIKTIAGPEIQNHLIEILNRECDQMGQLRFIQQMRTTSSFQDTDIPRDLDMLKAACKGFTDKR
jgi:predicted nucleotidyltransferase